MYFTNSIVNTNYICLIRHLPSESSWIFPYWLSYWKNKSCGSWFWTKCRNWIQYRSRRWGKFVWYRHRWGYARRNHQIEKGTWISLFHSWLSNSNWRTERPKIVIFLPLAIFKIKKDQVTMKYSLRQALLFIYFFNRYIFYIETIRPISSIKSLNILTRV